VGWLRGKTVACVVGTAYRNFTDSGFLFGENRCFRFSPRMNFKKSWLERLTEIFDKIFENLLTAQNRNAILCNIQK
jgi:hypothetical protein